MALWRVRGAASFAALAAPRRHGGDRRRSGPVSVSCIPDAADAPTTAHPQVAFAIGRKVGGAVQRNALRRRLRHELADLDRSGHLAPGRYLVGVAPGADRLEAGVLLGHLRASLTALGAVPAGVASSNVRSGGAA